MPLGCYVANSNSHKSMVPKSPPPSPRPSSLPLLFCYRQEMKSKHIVQHSLFHHLLLPPPPPRLSSFLRRGRANCGSYLWPPGRNSETSVPWYTLLYMCKYPHRHHMKVSSKVSALVHFAMHIHEMASFSEILPGL